MKLLTALIIFVLLPTGTARAQDIELQVELMNRVGTDTSRKGDLISGRVLSPQALQGDIVEGKVSDSRSGAKMGGKAVLSLSFDKLRHAGGLMDISTQVRSVVNSKGQMNADEEGRLIRGTNNVPKAAAGSGAGALIGGLAGGGKGALIGAAAGAVVSLVVIDIAADGPNVRLDPGSRLTVTANSRGGPALQSLTASAAAPPVQLAPATSVTTAAARAPASPAAPAPAAAVSSAAQPTASSAATPQDASAQPAAAAQPDLTAVKSDFIPGDKTIFLDDFTDMAGDEPPPHWKVRGGAAELRAGQGVRQLTVKSKGAGLAPNLTALPKNFTMELEVKHNGHETVANWRFPAKTGREAMFFRTAVNYDKLAVFFKVGDETITNQQLSVSFEQPIKEALWIQNGRLRLYVNGQRLFDVNQIQLPDLGTPELKADIPEQGVADKTPDPHIGFRFVRFAESTPDFSQMISTAGRYVTHGILFDTDSDRIKTDSAPVIKLIARGLETNPNLKVQIEGHTDSTGDADHNMGLSKRRAEAVKAVLVSQFNVEGGRLTTAGLGHTKPIESNDTPTGRAQNRRVEFVRQ